MFKNYFKVAVRNLLRNKGFSFLNVSGLAIGMASAILILLWIQNEVSYDRFHANGNRVYQVWGNNIVSGQIRTGMATPEIMAPGLKNDVPEIEQASRISWGQDYLLSVNDKKLKATGNYVDSSFLNMFSFPLVKGNRNTALSNPYSIVLTQKLAKNVFGNEDALGKIVKVDNNENYKRAGGLKDLPGNTEFNF